MVAATAGTRSSRSPTARSSRRAAREAAVPLERATLRGELSLDVDPDLVMDLLVAPLFYRAFVSHDPVDDAYIASLVDAVLRAVVA